MNNKTLIILTGIIALALISGYVGYRCGVATHEEVWRDTTTYVDTIAYYKPVPKDSTVVKYVTEVFPVLHHDTLHTADTLHYMIGDSVAVQIPITQKSYEGKDYRAWVSGYKPVMDSIYVYPTTTVITKRVRIKHKWHLGVSGGYGYSIKSKQMEPYVGVGITYSLFDF